MPTAPDNRTLAELGLIGDAYAQYAPNIGATAAANNRNVLLGNFDAQAFYNANPGAQQDWESAIAAGELKGWTPAQHAAAFIGGMENDPRLNQYYTGGLTQDLDAAAKSAQVTQNELNTSAKKAAVDDVANLGGAASNAYYAANPGLASAANVLSSGVNTLDLGASPIAPVTFNAIPVGGGYSQEMVDRINGAGGGGGGFSAAKPELPVYYSAPKDTYSEPFLNAAKEYSSLALSPLQQMLQEQAMSDLRLGGSLSGEDVRMAQQAARAGQSARGLAMGKNAVGLEMLQTDALSRARMNERRGFASAVDQNAFTQQNANRQLGLGYAGLANSAQQANNSLGLGYNQLNENARQFGKSMGFNYAQLGQQAGMFNASNNLAAQQFNASLAQTQQANDRSFGLNSTAMLGNIANNAMAPLGATGTGYSQATNNYAVANGLTPNYNVFLGYGQDVNDTNYNAAQARYINSKNNAAAEKAAWIGFAGNVIGSTVGAIGGKKK